MGKVWKVPSTGITSSLPLPKPEVRKAQTLYSLFAKDCLTKRYKRVSEQAYDAKIAGRVFSERLASAPLTFSIRPIKIESFEAR